jgi:hypothetical protein
LLQSFLALILILPIWSGNVCFVPLEVCNFPFAFTGLTAKSLP